MNGQRRRCAHAHLLRAVFAASRTLLRRSINVRENMNVAKKQRISSLSAARSRVRWQRTELIWVGAVSVKVARKSEKQQHQA